MAAQELQALLQAIKELPAEVNVSVFARSLPYIRLIVNLAQPYAFARLQLKEPAM